MAKKKKKNEIAQAMAAMRTKKLSSQRRKEIAQKAAAARWGRANTSTKEVASGG